MDFLQFHLNNHIHPASTHQTNNPQTPISTRQVTPISINQEVKRILNLHKSLNHL